MERWMNKIKVLNRAFLTNSTIILAISLFLSFSLLGLNQLGLTYDECLFVNAALGGVTNEYIFMKIFNVPFMTYVYEGSLKAWLYFPVFKLFGVSMLSIRIPTILIAAAATIIWYKNSRLIFNEKIYSLIFLLILTTDAAFIHHANIEYNTISLLSLLTALTFYFYLRFITTELSQSLALFFVCVILGIFNRFNYVWLAFSLISAGMLYDRHRILLAYKKNFRRNLVITALFSFTLIAMVIFLLIPASEYPVGGSISGTLSLERVIMIAYLYWETMAGNFPYLVFYEKDLPYTWIKNLIETIVIFLALIPMISSRLSPINRAAFKAIKTRQLFFITTFLIMMGLMVITPPVRTSYHILAIWPLPHLIFLLSFSMLACLLPPKISKAILLSLTTIILAIQIATNVQYFISLKDKDTTIAANWTTAVYNLADYINANAQDYDAIVSLNFGINAQLIALSKDNEVRKKLHDETWYTLVRNPTTKVIRNMFYPFMNREDSENIAWLYETIFKNKKILLISAPSVSPYTDTVDFIEFASQHHIDVKFLTSITDKNEYPIYFLSSAANTDTNSQT